MPTKTRTIASLEALKLSKLPVLDVVAHEIAPYDAGRQWGPFDELGVRAIDDIWFPEKAEAKTIVFSLGASRTQGAQCVPVPAAVALERAFFHIQEVSGVAIRPCGELEGVSELQAGISSVLPSDDGAAMYLDRPEIALILGMLGTGKKKMADPIAQAESAFRGGSIFEAYYLARKCRESGKGDLKKAWFVELLSLSFLGLPEEALEAYEEYPERGGASPHSMLLAARFRLLLKQMNEARTILHTLTFNEEIGALAACELGRSYNMTGDFSRAIDAATLAISKDEGYAESYLVRGIAHRGLSYPSGDEDGLGEALKNFEAVAKRGGFGAAEASFHAGTVFGRLGALGQAEVSLRQSLFQRDRFSARDALVRVLCAAGRGREAEEELRILEKLAPTSTAKLREDIAAHLAPKTAQVGTETEEGGVADLLSGDFSVARSAAWTVVESWRLPLRRDLSDFALLDDFINRFAPAGDFPHEGQWGALGKLDVSVVSRVLALYLGDVLVEQKAGTWGDISPSHLTIQLSKSHTRIPIEAFVRDRILLGASGDNFSSLESIVAEIQGVGNLLSSVPAPRWWEMATGQEVEEFLASAAKGKKRLTEMGAVLTGGLGDLEEMDRVVEACFEPEATVKPGMESLVGESMESFVLEVSMYFASVVVAAVGAKWFSHEQPEGISLYHPGLGRVFPVAKLHRRVYLSTAADFSVRLSSFAFGVAAVAVQEGIRSGRYGDVDQVRAALIAMLPSMKDFSEVELQGVAQSLFGNR
jgi:tetratricopeptide (TPR) repeat protein